MSDSKMNKFERDPALNCIKICGLGVILNSVHQHNRFITQGNYKATCFDYRLVILRPISSIVSQDAMHTLVSIVFTSMEYIKLNHLSQRV